MRLDLFRAHAAGHQVTRRSLLKAGGALGAAAALGGTTVGSHLAPVARAGDTVGEDEPLNDDMFDLALVEAGGWAPGPYGPGDERGTFNEVTPVKTAAALRLLDAARPVVTYGLGETLSNGHPSFRADPPRVYDQRLAVLGYTPRPGVGVILQDTAPMGPNKVSLNEERMGAGFSYHMGTRVDNLNHIGVGNVFYNGFRGSQIAETWGTNRLGSEQMGPIVTRGIVLDMIDLKLAQGAVDDLFTVGRGQRVLRDAYRITIDDIEEAMRRQDIREITPGDVVLFRTGWTHVLAADPQRYVAGEPGIYLRETRYLARRRPALIGSDTWGLEVVDPAVTHGNLFACHQTLFLRYGIRIGEAIVTDRLVEDGVFEFVFLFTPTAAKGATAANTAPAALGQPRR